VAARDDDFSKLVVDRLAKRVGMKCSYPDCRAPTSGPDADGGVTNTGVAAHIMAASPGGARYNEMLTPEERSGINNGIWLCQTHAKLIDDDELTYAPAVLWAWKETAENMAALEALGYVVRKGRSFSDLAKKVPNLIAEMREDLSKRPLVRQIIVLSKKASYGGSATPSFVYYHEDHEDLLAVMTIMVHAGAIYDIAFNSVPRYNLTEEFVSYLIGETSMGGAHLDRF
jgi:hypothetical protein